MQSSSSPRLSDFVDDSGDDLMGSPASLDKVPFIPRPKRNDSDTEPHLHAVRSNLHLSQVRNVEKKLKCVRCLLIALAVFSVLLLLATLLVIFLVPSMVSSQVEEATSFASENSGGFASWKGNMEAGGVPIDFAVYVFDVLNPKEAANGSKIQVKEIGPYMYKEYRRKFNISYLDDGNIVEFYEQRYYVFDPDRSAPGLSPEDEFTTVNYVFQGFLDNSDLALFPPVLIDSAGIGFLCQAWRENMSGYNGGMNLEFTPFVRSRVQDVIFGQRNNSLLYVVRSWLQEFGLDPNLVNADVPGIATVNHTSVEDAFRRSNIGWTLTGKNDSASKGQILRWNNMSSMHVCPSVPSSDDPTQPGACVKYQHDWDEATANANGWIPLWGSDDANAIVGTDMVFWPRFMSEAEPDAFVDSIYRSAKLDAKWSDECPVDEVYGVKAMKYGLRAKDMENATSNSDNVPYFSFGPSGFLNVSRLAGLPLFVSKPHFLDSDLQIILSVDGVNPDPAKHDTHLYKNNFVGQTIAAREALQLNVFLPSTVFFQPSCLFGANATPYPCCTVEQLFEWNSQWTIYPAAENSGQTGTYVPVGYIVESFQITESQASDIKLAQNLYENGPRIGAIVGFSLLAVVLLAMGGLIMYQLRLKQSLII